MTRVQELRHKAEQFAARAAHARVRTERNTFLSLAQSCRFLANSQELSAPAEPELRRL